MGTRPVSWSESAFARRSWNVQDTSSLRIARGEIYDERSRPDLDSEAIDFRVASESFADVRKIKRRDLETLWLLTSHQGHKVPAVGGVLLFGRDRLTHFPDSWIQVC